MFLGDFKVSKLVVGPHRLDLLFSDLELVSDIVKHLVLFGDLPFLSLQFGLKLLDFGLSIISFLLDLSHFAFILLLQLDRCLELLLVGSQGIIHLLPLVKSFSSLLAHDEHLLGASLVDLSFLPGLEQLTLVGEALGHALFDLGLDEHNFFSILKGELALVFRQEFAGHI